jgi:CheY-like chemotaxis protein
MSRIFGAFEQGDPGITRRFGGLGLGLMLSKAFTEAHGGTLRAHSEGPGRGATFYADLPTCSDPSEISVPPAGTSDEAALPELRVLVVDDHADTAGTVARVLRVLGCKPVVAGSIASATQHVLGGRIDAVISDIHLPDGSGRDLARMLAPMKIPAVALSGAGMHKDVRESLEAGFLDHLVKPVSFDQLEGVIRKIASARERMTEVVGT